MFSENSFLQENTQLGQEWPVQLADFLKNNPKFAVLASVVIGLLAVLSSKFDYSLSQVTPKQINDELSRMKTPITRSVVTDEATPTPEQTIPKEYSGIVLIRPEEKMYEVMTAQGKNEISVGMHVTVQTAKGPVISATISEIISNQMEKDGPMVPQYAIIVPDKESDSKWADDASGHNIFGIDFEQIMKILPAHQ